MFWQKYNWQPVLMLQLQTSSYIVAMHSEGILIATALLQTLPLTFLILRVVCSQSCIARLVHVKYSS